MRRSGQLTQSRPPWRLAAAAVGLATLILGGQAADAVAPDRGTYAFTDTFVDTDVCAPEGFAVDVVETESGTYQVFRAQDGSVTRVEVHQDYTAVISANNHTIYERDRWQTFYYPDGSRVAGLTVHIQGPGGIVQLDAGQVGFNADGAVTYIHGPHPQFLGQTFCFALVP